MGVVRSVNIGLPKEVEWQNRKVRTGIFKHSTPANVQIRYTGLEGDGQADLIHHGGVDKAVYAYPVEHYAYWQEFLGKKPIAMGSFGENLTTEGIMEADIYLGDYWQVGSAILMAIQPRMPCSKLGIRFNDAAMTKHFSRARRNGIYFSVVQEGAVEQGSTIHLMKRSVYDISVQDVVDCYAMPKKYPEKVQQILSFPFLPQLLKSSFEQILK